MNQQYHTKKLSIELVTLPKIRHKSTHVQFLNQSIETSQYPNFSNQIFKQRKNHKSLSKLQCSLSKHRSQFHQLSSTNHQHFNTTFFKQQKLHQFYQQKQKLQKKKVYTMESPLRFSQNQSLSLKNSPLINKKYKKSVLFDLNKQQHYQGPMISIDYKIQMSWLRHQCNDSIFQLSRIGSTLNVYNKELFLFGGSPDIIKNNLIFHRFKVQSNQWKHINSSGSKPMLSLMYHSSNMFKQHMVVSGGISINKNELKKLFNPYIFAFNTNNQVWAQYNWGVYIKHHSSCIYNNCLIVYGGIDQKQTTNNILHIVQLNLIGNFQYSKTTSFPTSQYLSHHKMITTINEDLRLRKTFKLDGLIVFGGKNLHQQLSNTLFFIDNKEIQATEQMTQKVKKLQTIKINGPSPQKRMAHSFDLAKNKGLAILIGGVNQKNHYFSDIWILDLFSLSWTLIEQVPLLKHTGGIAYHSSCVNQSQIYIYGGLTKEKNDKQFYLIQTQKFKRQLSKNQSRKKIEALSTVSFKTFQ